MEIIRGKIQSAQKVVVYGPEGIGKSTFASHFPKTLFIDTEGSTKHMDVDRLPRPESWTMLMEEVQYVKANPAICDTLVVDTADWAEALCLQNICGAKKLTGIEDIGWGKGYTYLAEDFGRFLNLLEEIVRSGVHITVTAHAQMRKFEQPDELGAYDRWEMKLQKKTAALLKEWADTVLFANYQTHVVNVDNQGAQKGKNKAQGGKRIMYTAHHPCWDAKNRWGLPEELPFEYAQIAPYIPIRATAPAPAPEPAQAQPIEIERKQGDPEYLTSNDVMPVQNTPLSEPEDFPEPVVSNAVLGQLMANSKVTYREVQWAVAHAGNDGKGYYPIDTPIDNYDPGFVEGCLVAAWPQVFKMIEQKRGQDDQDYPY